MKFQNINNNKKLLKDYQRWKKLNKNNFFSLFDYTFHILNDKRVNTDILFASLEIFWPSFIQYDQYIFLEENYSKEKFDQLIHEEKNPEYWGNLFLVDEYFLNDENALEKAEFFSQTLKKTWKIKLQNDFPNKEFIVEYSYDDENEERSLTFYQKQFESH